MKIFLIVLLIVIAIALITILNHFIKFVSTIIGYLIIAPFAFIFQDFTLLEDYTNKKYYKKE